MVIQNHGSVKQMKQNNINITEAEAEFIGESIDLLMSKGITTKDQEKLIDSLLQKTNKIRGL